MPEIKARFSPLLFRFLTRRGAADVCRLYADLQAGWRQTLTLQRDALTAAGIEPQRLYADEASGRRDDRPGLRACLKALQPGNTLVVWKLDRLGHDLKHLVGLVDDLNQRHVGLKVLAGTGAHIDTTTANGRLVFGIFAALAEFEAELIRERTQAGLTAARGRVGGRPRKVTPATLKMAMAALADPQNNATDVARRLGITRTTLYTYVHGDGSVKEAGHRLLELEQSAPPAKATRSGGGESATPDRLLTGTRQARGRDTIATGGRGPPTTVGFWANAPAGPSFANILSIDSIASVGGAGSGVDWQVAGLDSEHSGDACQWDTGRSENSVCKTDLGASQGLCRIRAAVHLSSRVAKGASVNRTGSTPGCR